MKNMQKNKIIAIVLNSIGGLIAIGTVLFVILSKHTVSNILIGVIGVGVCLILMQIGLILCPSSDKPLTSEEKIKKKKNKNKNG